MKDDIEVLRERFHKDWAALKEACHAYHTTHRDQLGRVGGAKQCVCGNGVGGSPACRMLSALKAMFRSINPEQPQHYHRKFFEIMEGVV